MRENNPFSIAYTYKSDSLISRIEEQEEIIEMFSSEEPSNLTYMLTGANGTGKSLLLSTIYNHFKENSDWIVVHLDTKDNILENIAKRIYETGRTQHLFTKKEFDFSFQGKEFSLHGSTPVSSLFPLLTKMLDYLKKKNKKVLITIDDIDCSMPMVYFIQAYSTLLRQNYLVFLLMAGTYNNISNLQDEESITFLYRAPKIFLGPLNLSAIASSYCQYLGVNRERGLELAKLTKGYAYAYQVLGYLLYEKGNDTIDDKLFDEYDQYLAEYVYKKMYADLSDSDKKIVFAFKTSLPVKTSDLCERTGLKINAYKDRLIKSGLVLSPSDGYLQFALPRFEEFLETQEY